MGGICPLNFILFHSSCPLYHPALISAPSYYYTTFPRSRIWTKGTCVGSSRSFSLISLYTHKFKYLGYHNVKYSSLGDQAPLLIPWKIQILSQSWLTLCWIIVIIPIPNWMSRWEALIMHKSGNKSCISSPVLWKFQVEWTQSKY